MGENEDIRINIEKYKERAKNNDIVRNNIFQHLNLKSKVSTSELASLLNLDLKDLSYIRNSSLKKLGSFPLSNLSYIINSFISVLAKGSPALVNFFSRGKSTDFSF